MSELPSGTVTFLFTDLEGSTRLWEEHADAMRDGLARHDAILRAAVEEHDGRVVKTTGDGLHAAFARARDAVAAAVDAQRALQSEVWPLPEPLRVRMGVHTGEAEIRDGDYYGSAVNRAARVSAAAHGGQLLVSGATMEVVRDALDEQDAVVDLGEHRLRDLGRPEHLFQLSVKGLDSEFAPVRSLDAFPTNLRPQVTTFLGRSEEVDSLRGLLDTAPLVTLVGVGGVGKTRLAQQVAAELLPYRRDGAWIAELAPVSDPEVIADVVATALRVRQREGMTMAASIVDFLRTKDQVLVLDNCEHVVAAANELVADIVERCPRVTVIATSREALGVHGEQLWPVASLPTPRADADATTAPGAASVRLFVDRARLVRPDFALTDANVGAVVEICRRLDGIPLAIELAAARTGLLSPAQIAERLDERFRLLTGGKRGAVERHQTLRSTVDWSFDLLDEDAQRVFERLGAFAGGFTLEAAEAVAATPGEGVDILDALDELVAKSMLVAESTDDDTRYRLLETLRQYARERLEERGDADEVRRRHAEHYVAYVRDACDRLRGADEVRWTRRVAAELENLRAAVTWAADVGEPAIAVELVAPLVFMNAIHQNWGISGIAEVAGQAPGAADQDRYPEVCIIRAFGTYAGGDFARARHLGDLAVDAALARGADRYEVLFFRASIEAWGGSVTAAVEFLARARAAPDRDERLAGYLGSEAVLAAAFGDDPARVRTDAEAALAAAHAAGHPSSTAMARYALGRALETTDLERAIREYETALEFAREVASTYVPMTQGRLVALYARAGRPRAAMHLLADSLAYWREAGLGAFVAWMLMIAVSALAVLDEWDTAALVCAVVDGDQARLSEVIATERVRYEAARLTVEEHLGAEAFAARALDVARMDVDAALDRIVEEARRIAEVGDA